MDERYRNYIQETELSQYAKPSLNSLGRLKPLHDGGNRTEFERDVHSVLYSLPFRRLKQKTQVFFSPINDHICTRIEHVNHDLSSPFSGEKGIEKEPDFNPASLSQYVANQDVNVELGTRYTSWQQNF